VRRPNALPGDAVVTPAELVIVDDGADSVTDLMPDHRRIRHFRTTDSLDEKFGHRMPAARLDTTMNLCATAPRISVPPAVREKSHTSGVAADDLSSSRTLAAFKDRHRGEDFVVCGCGESLRGFQRPPGVVTIGVNDVGRQFTPDYLVVVNPPGQFRGNRFQFVRESAARVIFTQLELGLRHKHVVRFRLGQRGGTDTADPNVLHYTQNSPYVAVCLAALMGARRIGLLGVDLTGGHFFGGTNPHPLSRQLHRIDAEYDALRRALALRGVELVNLSALSRLTTLPRADTDQFLKTPGDASAFPTVTQPPAPGPARQRVFFVNYRFLSCGDVFATGLAHAAQRLDVAHEAAWWDDPKLADKIRAFAPDLVFVVHGRRCAQRWGSALREWKSAVWLLDEPYEVDDTSRWSSTFGTVFVNDPSTLERHRNAHYLPVCFDPEVHFDSSAPRPLGVGFIGGANVRREQWLNQLGESGLLSYVVGGPWRAPALNKLSRSRNIPAAQTADLYRQTKVVINIFRQQHHYNHHHLPATSLNPRVYEALACGALVISEPRPELERLSPNLPVFHDEKELIGLVREMAGDETRAQAMQRECAAILREHTYANRLQTVLSICCPVAAGVEQPVKSIASSIVIPPPALCRGTAASGVDQAGPVASAPPVPSASRTQSHCGPLPFSAMPRRNLIYHVWPVRDSLWRWNIDQLLKRIDIFNGRRIVGIVHDSRSDPPEEVMKALDGHGCEFVVHPNADTGEAITFPEMLERVASDDPNEITFYGHAKGVKYGSKASSSVRQWTEALYMTALDDWLSVVHQLQQFGMTGAFKMRGRFRSHRQCSDWHYSGTFFWFRHARVFNRSWHVVPQFYCGVEAWPGTLFRAEETGCLFLDGLTDLPYLANFWRRRGNVALKNWLAARKTVPVPDDLARPTAPADEPGPRIEQVPSEFEWFASQVLAAGARRVLTTGALHGGTEWWLARACHRAGVALDLTVVESAPLPELRATLADATDRFGTRITLVEGCSQSAEVQARLQPPFDVVFSDADRRYAAVCQDWELARAVHARQVAFHDIVDSHWHVQCRCCVSRLWHELKSRFPTTECGSGEWGGVGIVSLPHSS